MRCGRGSKSWKIQGNAQDQSIVGKCWKKIGWPDASECQACQIEEGAEKHRLYHCPEWYEVRREIPEACSRLEQTARTSKKEWKWQRGIVTHRLSGSQWNRGHFSWRKWKCQAQMLGYTSRRLQGPRCHRRFFAGHCWEVVSMWLGGGAVGL